MAPIQPEASVATTGLGIRYIGDYCYAYSGVIDLVGASTETQLEFTTGSGLISGEYTFGADANDIDSETYLGFLIYLNNGGENLKKYILNIILLPLQIILKLNYLKY